jgi:type I restriction enzyme M protein
MSIEKTLFAAADKMRGSMDAGEYKHIALGLLFLRHVSMSFERLHDQLSREEYSDPEDPDEYLAESIFWVPEKARWSTLAKQSKDPKIGIMIDDAMRAIEADNESLKGALPKVFGKESIDRTMLTGLIDLFTNLKMEGSKADFDLIGRIYEYCIGEFASSEGKRGGEFYTPKSVVDTLIEMIEPTKGRVYDPCCGTGGFFVQSEKFIDAHSGQRNDIAIYGQERNHTTFGLARMNLAIRGIFGDIRWNSEGTLVKDAFADERFDYVLANPPFNISDWSGELLREDARWKYGAPPVGNANFAWIQHIHHHLSASGIGGVVMANGSMSSMSGARATSAVRWSRATQWMPWWRCRGSCSMVRKFRPACGSWPRTNPTASPRRQSCATGGVRCCSSMPARWGRWCRAAASRRNCPRKRSPALPPPITPGVESRKRVPTKMCRASVNLRTRRRSPSTISS